jgi:sec-independent protein translocase protein TatA
MGNIGAPELLLILLIVVLLFGAKKIPEIANSLGKGIKEFKKAQKDIEKDDAGQSAPPANTKETKDAKPEQKS